MESATHCPVERLRLREALRLIQRAFVFEVGSSPRKGVRLSGCELSNRDSASSGMQTLHPRKPRLAVVSPFIDKSHGTERMVIEWIDRLAATFEIHIYTQRATDIDPTRFVLHNIPKLPGPHLFNFLWWFIANHWWRRRDARSKNLQFDLVYSPGTNCLDADAVTVHIVFAEFVRRVRRELRFSRSRVRLWPRILHRRLYYRTIMFFERRVFLNCRTKIILTASKTAEELRRHFGNTQTLPVIPAGIDHQVFNPTTRCRLRHNARRSLGLEADHFVLLLIGNDWHNKGLRTLLDALSQLSDLPLDLLVVGRDDPATFIHAIQERALEKSVRFLPPRKDVEFYYAAADAYAGPSLEDTFALPALEAMGCGLPVIISVRAGAAAVVTHGSDGLILDGPTDARELAGVIRSLCEDPLLGQRLGRNAVATASQYSWDHSARKLAVVFDEILRSKRKTRRSDVPGPIL